MFHVEQFLIFLSAVGVISSPLCASPTVCQPIGIGGDYSADVREQSNLALQYLLFGDTEHAKACVAQAEQEGGTPLSHAVQLLLEPNEDIRKAIEQDLNNASMTPLETFRVRNLLLLGSGDVEGSARELLKHAETYRADTPAAAWGIVLLHYASRGYDADGKPTEQQQEALNKADELRKEYPKNPLIAYARALLDEGAPEVSTQALQSARDASVAFIDEPGVRLLEGHLLFRSGQYEEALLAYQTASAYSGPYMSLQARYAIAVTLFCLQRSEESLTLRKELNAQPLSEDADMRLLQLWEIHTLPLRILMTRPERLTLTEIRAARNTAMGEQGNALSLYKDCLVATALARYHHEKGKDGIASAFIDKAEGHYQALLQKQSEIQPGLMNTFYFRACESCAVAVNLAKAMVFRETGDAWQQLAEDARRPAARLLPPSMPKVPRGTSAKN